MSDSVFNSANRTGQQTKDIPDAEKRTPSGREIMQDVLSRPRHSGKSSGEDGAVINGVVIGSFSGLDEQGNAMVLFDGCPGDQPVTAVSTTRFTDFDSGRAVALSFVGSDPAKPIILGLVVQPQLERPPGSTHKTSDPELDVTLDGEKVTLSAEQEIVLKCGKSSITLTRAGKIIIKGEYLSNHSTGVNRIKGGSVQIN